MGEGCEGLRHVGAADRTYFSGPVRWFLFVVAGVGRSRDGCTLTQNVRLF